jgi:hypothetical protein
MSTGCRPALNSGVNISGSDHLSIALLVLQLDLFATVKTSTMSGLTIEFLWDERNR